MSKGHTSYKEKMGWKRRSDERADAIEQSFADKISYGEGSPTNPADKRLVEFGKDLYFRRNRYGYTYDDFIFDFKNSFNINGINLETYTTFKGYFNDLEYFPLLNLIEDIMSKKDVQDLIVSGYNYAKNNPHEILIYFGRELFYRGSTRGYTYENFLNDINGIVFVPRKRKENTRVYNQFCNAFQGYEFFPSYEQIVELKKGKLCDLILSGYKKAKNEPDKSPKFVGANGSTRKRVPPREC